MIGDGTHLYAGAHFNARFQTALESADTAWSNFNAQMFDEGPFEMAIDHANGILYSAQVRSGVSLPQIEVTGVYIPIETALTSSIAAAPTRARYS